MKVNKESNKRALFENRREFFKTYAVSMISVSVLMAGFIIFITVDNHVRPIISTSHYHFNLQYRAGNETAMDEVVNNSLVPILQMYARHPTWKTNIEFQGMMLEWMKDMDSRGAIRNTTINGKIYNGSALLKYLIDRGQVQLIVFQYSDALTLAYPYIDLYKSIKYTRQMLKDMGFINDSNTKAVSRCVLLQEGQFLLGSSRVVEDFKLPNGNPAYDTFMTIRDSLTYFNVERQSPIYSYSLGGNEIYVLPYYFSDRDAGVFHHVIWFQDGENVNAGDRVTWESSGLVNKTEDSFFFPLSEDRQENHERRIMDLERQGNIFMTMDEWVDYLLDHDLAMPLDNYVPETHWNVFRYHSSFIWMGETAGQSFYDDSEINARNYRTHQILLNTEVLLNYSYFTLGTINATEYDSLNSILTRAWLDLAEAQVTDSTGLNPWIFEGETAFIKTTNAIANATLIQARVINATPIFNSTIHGLKKSIQIVPTNLGSTGDAVLVNESSFVNFTKIADASIDNLDSITIKTMNNNSFSIQKNKIEITWDPSINNLEYYDIKINFPRTNTSGLDEKWSYIKFIGNFSQVRYTPTLWDNITVELNRSSYNPELIDYYGDWEDNLQDNYEIYLPLANGLFYSVGGSFAIIKNCTASHLAMKWKDDEIRFMQTETLSNLNPAGETWQYFILNNVTVEQALAFARIANPKLPLTISEVNLT
ncbi:MAG: hypothetical protein ACTSVI_10955 [Promethearchaeota archaeon]